MLPVCCLILRLSPTVTLPTPCGMFVRQVADRAVLAGGRLLMGSRLARTFLLVYTVLLHFVILLLFYYATTPCPAPLAVLDGAAAEAAVAAAGGAVAAGGAAAGRMLQWARLRGGWTGPAGRG